MKFAPTAAGAETVGETAKVMVAEGALVIEVVPSLTRTVYGPLNLIA